MHANNLEKGHIHFAVVFISDIWTHASCGVCIMLIRFTYMYIYKHTCQRNKGCKHGAKQHFAIFVNMVLSGIWLRANTIEVSANIYLYNIITVRVGAVKCALVHIIWQSCKHGAKEYICRLCYRSKYSQTWYLPYVCCPC